MTKVLLPSTVLLSSFTAYCITGIWIASSCDDVVLVDVSSHSSAFVETGETVKLGQKLLEFDRKLISEAGYSLVTPVLVTNSDDFEQVEITGDEKVKAGDLLLSIM